MCSPDILESEQFEQLNYLDLMSRTSQPVHCSETCKDRAFGYERHALDSLAFFDVGISNIDGNYTARYCAPILLKGASSACLRERGG